MQKEIQLQSQTLKSLIENSVVSFPNNPSIAFLNDKPITYSQLGKEIDKVSDLLFSYGLKKGDKVALFSHNMPNWVIAFFAVAAKGLIIVPILPDFSAEEAGNVLEHSESSILFVSDRLYSRVENIETPNLTTIIKLDDFSIIKSSKDPVKVKKTTINVEEEETGAIIYTSGTTGRLKGVMLSHKNMVFVAATSFDVFPITHEDVFLSVLPLSHTYENAIGMLYPIMYGPQFII